MSVFSLLVDDAVEKGDLECYGVIVMTAVADHAGIVDRHAVIIGQQDHVDLKCLICPSDGHCGRYASHVRIEWVFDVS